MTVVDQRYDTMLYGRTEAYQQRAADVFNAGVYAVPIVAVDWAADQSRIKTVVGTISGVETIGTGITFPPDDHVARDVVSMTAHVELKGEVDRLHAENAALHDKVASLEAALISDAALRDRIVACLNAGEARIDELLAENARLTPVASSAPHPGAVAARAIGAVIAGWRPVV